MVDQNDTVAPQVDPTGRLEQALDRIAYALHRKPQAEGDLDVQALAANVDALRVRVRDALSAVEEKDEG